MNINKLLSSFYTGIFKFFPPFINLYLSKIFKKLHDLNLKSSYSSDFLSEMNIENSKFKLWLMKNDNQAQSVYQPLHKKKITYEAVMIKTLISVEKKLKPSNFFDIGSFMGYYSCFVSKYFDEKIKVFAIESNKEYCNYINKSLKENNFKNTVVINEILSNIQEDLFVYKEGVYKSNIFNKDQKSNKSNTLDSICLEKKIKPEIMKIDVHGAEGKVLYGSKKILNEFVKVILLELHTDEYINKFSEGLNRKKIIEYLILSNFKCYLISSFRGFEESKDLQEKYDKKGKFDYIKIDLENFDQIFFDRDQADQFVFVCKNDLDIKSFDCFH